MNAPHQLPVLCLTLNFSTTNLFTSPSFTDVEFTSTYFQFSGIQLRAARDGNEWDRGFVCQKPQTGCPGPRGGPCDKLQTACNSDLMTVFCFSLLRIVISCLRINIIETRPNGNSQLCISLREKTTGLHNSSICLHFDFI